MQTSGGTQRAQQLGEVYKKNKKTWSGCLHSVGRLEWRTFAAALVSSSGGPREPHPPFVAIVLLLSPAVSGLHGRRCAAPSILTNLVSSSFARYSSSLLCRFALRLFPELVRSP